MKNKKLTMLVFIWTSLLILAVNIVVVVVFSNRQMQDSFYNSLNIASLVIAFISLITSCFFSFSLYVQSLTQTKINDKLPKKEDSYITENYSLFNLEKEFSVFSVDDEKDDLIANKKYLTNTQENEKNDLTRVVFLPTDSLNKSTYKVVAHSLEIYSKFNLLKSFENKLNNCDAQYAYNILQRGYNCICVDLGIPHKKLIGLLDEASCLRINLDIISIFNVCFNISFDIKIEGKKDVGLNVDLEKLPDLNTYVVHHTNYFIKSKTIVS